MSTLHSTRLHAAPLLALALGAPVQALGQDQVMQAMQPAKLTVEKFTLIDSAPHIKRLGTVMLNTDLFLPKTSQSNARAAVSASFVSRTIEFKLTENTTYLIQVSNESRPQADVLSISGSLGKNEFSTVTMTVTPESYLLTIQDLSRSLVYRVVGDTETGVGSVTEVDLTKRPPVVHAPPVIPPGRQ